VPDLPSRRAFFQGLSGAALAVSSSRSFGQTGPAPVQINKLTDTFLDITGAG
jgi:hypothetical protein